MAESDPAKELLETVNAAAGRARAAWLAFIGVLAYLFVAVGATTHTQLLLEAPVKLPVVDVSLPVAGFFALAPLIFLLVHLNLLLLIYILAQKFGRLQRRSELLDVARRAPCRARLDSFVYVQTYSGASHTPASGGCCG